MSRLAAKQWERKSIEWKDERGCTEGGSGDKEIDIRCAIGI